MMTENLQEMVSSNGNNTNGMGEYDIIMSHSAKPAKLPDIERKESSQGQGLQAMEKSEPLVSEVPTMDIIEMPEAELVNEANPSRQRLLKQKLSRRQLWWTQR